MLGSAALGTAIGLTMLFGLTSLLCSGVTEAVSNFMQLRARYLLTGLRAMLDAPESGTSKTDAPESGTSKTDAPESGTSRTDAPVAVASTTDGSTGARDADPQKALAGSKAVPRAEVKAGKDAKKKLHEATLIPATTAEARRAVQERTETGAPELAPGTFTLALFGSPLIRCLQTRKVLTGQLRNPQYISSTTFARAIIDTLLPSAVASGQQAGSGSVLTELSVAAGKLPPGQLQSTLQAFLSQSEGKFTTFENSLESWYDDQMARISGWYKRWSRVVLGVVGLIAAVLINIDTVQVTHALYVDAPVRQAVATAADSGALCQGETSAKDRATCAQDELKQLRVGGLPLGYQSGCQFIHHPARCWAWSPNSTLHTWDLPLKILGWIVTAFAVSFGAPFWFDALSRLGSLRSAGAKPAAGTASR